LGLRSAEAWRTTCRCGRRSLRWRRSCATHVHAPAAMSTGNGDARSCSGHRYELRS